MLFQQIYFMYTLQCCSHEVHLHAVHVYPGLEVAGISWMMCKFAPDLT